MLTSEVLDRAADEIERRGWVRGTEGWPLEWSDSDAPVCLEGGIMAAQGLVWQPGFYDEFKTCPAYRAMHSYLALDTAGQPCNWNDRAERTQAEVIEVLRAAAMVERTREAAEQLVAVSA